MASAMTPQEILTCIETRAIPMDMHIHMTDWARSQAADLKSQSPEYQNLDLRLYIEGKGCDGFYYGVAFDHTRDHDFIFNHGAIRIIVDPESLSFVFGSTIDWTDDERGRGFLVDNPNHQRYRGKFFKKEAWRSSLPRPRSQRA